MLQTARMVMVKIKHIYIVFGWFVTISSLAHAGFPWLVSDDEKTSWFSGPATKCYFARKWHNIGDTFHPVLSPFGLMPCMNCTCLKHPQFAFLRPRVNCRNTRNECPLLSCADPISKNDECCPTCHKEYITILLQSSNQPLSEVGRLHLTVSQKTMFISIKLDRFMTPKHLKFKRKENGAVLHSVPTNEMAASETANRICVESEMPNEQLAYLLQQEDVIVELTVNNSITFEGSLAYFHKFSEVPFVALLGPRESTPNVPRIAGGFAGMTADKDKDKVIIRTAIIFQNGDKMFDDIEHEQTIVVKIVKRPWKAEKLSPVLKRFSFKVRKEDMITGKPVLRTFEWQWPRSAYLRWMVRSILFVTVEFTWRGYSSNLFGRLLVQDSCRKFYSVLSGGNLDSSSSASFSGYAAVKIDARAKIHIKVAGKGIAKTRKMDVFIVDGDDLVLKKLATIRRNPEVDSFEVTGTWEKPSASVLTLLFNGRIYVKVASHFQRHADMKGRIQQYLYLNQADYSKGSILSIHGINGEMSSKIGASAILSADELCNIHYVIYISGYGDSSSAYKTINSVLKLDGVFDRGRRSSRGIALAGFNRNYISRGSFIEPSLDLLNGIASGMAHILISTRRMTTGELKGQISLSSSRCSKISKASSNPLLQRSLVGSDLDVGVCLHQGRFYDHGAQWHPLNKDGVSKIYCKICRCNQRHVTVKQISCPKPSCSDPIIVHEHCCPVCTSLPNTKAVDPRKACTVGMPSRNEIRAVGEAWHPMIHPFGMIKCIVCICKSAPGDYKCTRVLCPKLKCKHAERFPGSCCPTCLDAKSQSSDVYTREITAVGNTNGKTKAGCKYGRISYKHGTSWKPMLPQFGILRCVICRCKNGRVRCRRLKCLKSSRCRIRNGKIPKDPCCRHCNLRRKP